MIIKEMTASFGRLERAQLKLADGLNVIHAPNESGKSTWCAFIRAMFYGISSRERDKKGFLAEKNRYLPWSGIPMEGEMTLEWQGRDITLRRFTKGATPFGGFSAVYTDTQQPVPDLNGQNCGEVLLGVSREVWERSAFIGTAPTLVINHSSELERRITALFSSGQEDISFSQAEGKLREWLRHRQHNRSGLIPKLEEELADLDLTLTRMQAAGNRLSSAQEQRSALEEQLRTLEAELHIHQRLAQRQTNQRYAQALQERSQLRTQMDELLAQQTRFGTLPHRDRLRDAQVQLQRLTLQEEDLLRQNDTTHSAPPSEPSDPRFPGLDGVQAVRLAQDERAQAEALLARTRDAAQRGRRSLFIAPILLAAASITGAALHMLPIGLLAGGVLAALWVVISLLQSKKHTARIQAQLQTILDRWHATQPQQITDAAEDYRQQWDHFLRAQEDYDRAQTQLNTRRDTLAQAFEELVAFVRSFAPDVRSLSGCSTALANALELEDRLRECRDKLDLATRRCDDLKAQNAQETDTLELLHTPERTMEQTQQALEQSRSNLAVLEQQAAMAQGELLTLGDRAQLEARKEQLQSQLERRRQEYAAISLALDGLRQANTTMQERFAPELNQRSGQILSALTDGRYACVVLDREFDASARSTDSLLPRSALSLSRGTVDQLYLAVRLAVCQLCLGEQESSPLILDDALLSFDDTRMALALDYLSGLDQQVLLFSCQARESNQGVGTILTLQS